MYELIIELLRMSVKPEKTIKDKAKVLGFFGLLLIMVLVAAYVYEQFIKKEQPPVTINVYNENKE